MYIEKYNCAAEKIFVLNKLQLCLKIYKCTSNSFKIKQCNTKKYFCAKKYKSVPQNMKNTGKTKYS